MMTKMLYRSRQRCRGSSRRPSCRGCLRHYQSVVLLVLVSRETRAEIARELGRASPEPRGKRKPGRPTRQVGVHLRQRRHHARLQHGLHPHGQRHHQRPHVLPLFVIEHTQATSLYALSHPSLSHTALTSDLWFTAASLPKVHQSSLSNTHAILRFRLGKSRMFFGLSLLHTRLAIQDFQPSQGMNQFAELTQHGKQDWEILGQQQDLHSGNEGGPVGSFEQREFQDTSMRHSETSQKTRRTAQSHTRSRLVP